MSQRDLSLMKVNNLIVMRAQCLWFSLLTCCPFPCHYPLPFAKARVGIFANITTWKVDLHTRYPLSVYLNSQLCRVSKFRIAAEDQMNGNWEKKRHEKHKKASCMVMVRNTAFAGGSWWKVSWLGGSKWHPVRFAWLTLAFKLPAEKLGSKIMKGAHLAPSALYI